MDTIVSLDQRRPIGCDIPLPLYVQVVQYIEHKIESEQWHSGQLLPSEEELCKYFAVSRTVIRQALNYLTQKGAVSKQSGKRTRIAAPRYHGDLMADYPDFFQDALARGKSVSTRVLEAQVIPAGAEIAEHLQIAEGEAVFMLKRLRLFDSEPTVLLLTYLPERICPSLSHEDFATYSLRELLAQRYGLVMARSLRAISASAASKTEAKLLGVRVGSPLLVLKSLALLDDGTPLRYFIEWHRADRAEFKVHLIHEKPSSTYRHSRTRYRSEPAQPEPRI